MEQDNYSLKLENQHLKKNIEEKNRLIEKFFEKQKTITVESSPKLVTEIVKEFKIQIENLKKTTIIDNRLSLDSDSSIKMSESIVERNSIAEKLAENKILLSRCKPSIEEEKSDENNFTDKLIENLKSKDEKVLSDFQDSQEKNVKTESNCFEIAIRESKSFSSIDLNDKEEENEELKDHSKVLEELKNQIKNLTDELSSLKIQHLQEDERLHIELKNSIEDNDKKNEENENLKAEVLKLNELNASLMGKQNNSLKDLEEKTKLNEEYNKIIQKLTVEKNEIEQKINEKLDLLHKQETDIFNLKEFNLRNQTEFDEIMNKNKEELVKSLNGYSVLNKRNEDLKTEIENLKNIQKDFDSRLEQNNRILKEKEEINDKKETKILENLQVISELGAKLEETKKQNQDEKMKISQNYEFEIQKLSQNFQKLEEEKIKTESTFYLKNETYENKLKQAKEEFSKAFEEQKCQYEEKQIALNNDYQSTFEKCSQEKQKIIEEMELKYQNDFVLLEKENEIKLKNQQATHLLKIEELKNNFGFELENIRKQKELEFNSIQEKIEKITSDNNIKISLLESKLENKTHRIDELEFQNSALTENIEEMKKIINNSENEINKKYEQKLEESNQLKHENRNISEKIIDLQVKLEELIEIKNVLFEEKKSLIIEVERTKNKFIDMNAEFMSKEKDLINSKSELQKILNSLEEEIFKSKSDHKIELEFFKKSLLEEKENYSMQEEEKRKLIEALNLKQDHLTKLNNENEQRSEFLKHVQSQLKEVSCSKESLEEEKKELLAIFSTFKNELEKSNELNKQLNLKISDYENEIHIKNKEIANFTSEVVVLKSNGTDIEKKSLLKIEELSKKINDLKSLNNNLENSNKNLNKQILESMTTIEQNEQLLTHWKNENSKIDGMINQLNEKNSIIDQQKSIIMLQEVENAENRKNILQKDLEITELNEKYALIQEKFENLSSKLGESQTLISELELKIKNQQIAASNLHQIHQNENLLSQYEAKIKEQDSIIRENTTKLLEQKSLEKALEQKENEIKKEFLKLNEALSDWEIKKAEVQSKLDELSFLKSELINSEDVTLGESMKMQPLYNELSKKDEKYNEIIFELNQNLEHINNKINSVVIMINPLIEEDEEKIDEKTNVFEKIEKLYKFGLLMSQKAKIEKEKEQEGPYLMDSILGEAPSYNDRAPSMLNPKIFQKNRKEETEVCKQCRIF